ncbi:MAG: efflux transporter outer membrane subunit [Myxococcota bacterium]
MRFTWSPLSAMAGAWLLAGCALHDVEESPEPPAPVPEGYSRAGDAPLDADGWWHAFGDPGLDAAMARTLDDNLDLGRAWARVDQASALARQSRAGWWPQIDASLGAQKQQQHIFASEPIGKITSKTSIFNMSVGASYEVDLWGKVREAKEAADLDLQATREDLESLAVTLTSQVAETWFALAEQRALRALLDEQIEVAEEYLELVSLRFRQGFASALDVRQQRQQVRRLQSQTPLVDAQIDVLRTQLAVLQGRAPKAEVDTPEAGLPEPPPLPDPGVPADLLQRRPDVESARLRVAAADHRVGVAIADRFPALRFSGSTGFQDPSIVDIFSSWIWNLAANLVAPIVDGGRRAAEVDRARAVVEERLKAYGQTVLVAVKEVEDALARETWQRRHVEAIEAELASARQTLEEARTRYLQGLIDYLPVLTALQGVQQAEQRLLSARRQLLSIRIQLHRALGGTWTEDLERGEDATGDPS